MKPNLKFLLLLLFTGIMLTSCDKTITYPSISDTATSVHHPGQFVWHDLVSPNPKASMEFYKNVFGWTYTTLGSDETAYYVIHSNGKAIGGISKLASENGTVGEWIGSISVSNVADAVEYNKKKGGKTIFKAMSIKGRGKTALVQDPQGAIVSFINSESGDPAIEINNVWLWNELWTNDMEASLSYYKGLIPYQADKVQQAKDTYYAFTNGGKKLSGIMANPVDKMRTSWIPYIKVSNITAVVDKARNNDASIISEPNDNVRNGTLAIIQDPIGAKFALQVLNTTN